MPRRFLRFPADAALAATRAAAPTAATALATSPFTFPTWIAAVNGIYLMRLGDVAWPLVCIILAAISFATNVILSKRGAPDSSLPPPLAEAAPAVGDMDSTTSKTATDGGRLREEMMELVRESNLMRDEKVAALEAENKLVREENQHMRHESTLAREKITALEATVASNLTNLTVTKIRQKVATLEAEVASLKRINALEAEAASLKISMLQGKQTTPLKPQLGLKA